jgi:hypothetical protein
MAGPWWLILAISFGLGMIHVFAGKLKFLDVIPRSRWLSLSGGVSVAYVFVHILPDIAKSQEYLRRAAEALALGFLENHAYLLALAGLLVFYGLEALAKNSRQASRLQEQGDVTTPGVFWLHVGSFGFYNLLIGYLLVHREVPGRVSLAFFTAAMATHFIVNDYGLREHHKERYTLYGRWILLATVVAGTTTGLLTTIAEAALAALFGFLAGGVILNVLKEELPEERQSSLVAFMLGAVLYSAVLIVV